MLISVSLPSFSFSFSASFTVTVLEAVSLAAGGGGAASVSLEAAAAEVAPGCWLLVFTTGVTADLIADSNSATASLLAAVSPSVWRKVRLAATLSVGGTMKQMR